MRLPISFVAFNNFTASSMRAADDARANAVAITQGGRRALRSARSASDRAERALLETLPAGERMRFVKLLQTVASGADALEVDGKPNGRGRRRRP